MANANGRKYVSIELLGILALLVGVSLFIGDAPQDGLWALKGASTTCLAGFILYLWGRIGAVRA